MPTSSSGCAQQRPAGKTVTRPTTAPVERWCAARTTTGKGGEPMFTSVDYDKFRALRITHVATRFEELITDETNDQLTPEQIFLTAVDDALDARREARIDRLIRSAGF